METSQDLKAEHEKASAERFVQEHNKEFKYNFVFKEQARPPKPDFLYYDAQKDATIGIEVTDAYYDDKAAKGTWDIVRGKVDRSGWAGINPDEKLALSISYRVETKCHKKYAVQHPVILLIVVHPALSLNDSEFRKDVLPKVKLPQIIPFKNVYLDASFQSYHVFHCLY